MKAARHRPASQPDGTRPDLSGEVTRPERPGEVSRAELPGEVAELVGELSETASPSRRRRLSAAISRLTGRSRRAGWHGAQSGGRWLTSQVLAMAPRLPVRDQQTLRAQFPGLNPEELADALIRGSALAGGAVAGGGGRAPAPGARVPRGGGGGGRNPPGGPAVSAPTGATPSVGAPRPRGADRVIPRARLSSSAGSAIPTGV